MIQGHMMKQRQNNKSPVNCKTFRDNK